jgi:glycosyltransferase involved in cell wall biosynthesis
MLSACTIIACNYLPFARVLAESFLDHHPGAPFTILLIDGNGDAPAGGDPRVTWLGLGDLGLEAAEIRRLAAIYDVTELATAVKPLLLQRLLDQGHETAVYLDPDIRVYAPLDPLADLVRAHGIVLTPHSTEPYPRDGRQVDAFFILSAGVYNLGFIAVGPQARPFLAWWWSLTRREALVDVAKMMFTDQRFVEFVPAFFDHVILKDPGWNVAYWNLHGRIVAGSDGAWTVNGGPLRFFHFSGFDPSTPWLLSKYQGERPRILLSERPALARLCEAYASELRRTGAERPSSSYGWARLPSGTELTTRMRRLYWTALRDWEAGRGPEPPNPFEQPDTFIDWLNAPGSGTAGVTRFLYSIYEDRTDLQVAFRDLSGAGASSFFDWIWRHGIAPERIPPELMPPPASPAAVDAPEPVVLTEGVTVAGYFRAELGIAQAARLILSAIEAAGIPHATVIWDATLNRQRHAFAERTAAGAACDINLVCVNADSTPAFARAMGPGFFEGRHTIGYWFWETSAFPPSMHTAFDFVDEVWAATDFVADAIRGAGSGVPVYTVPPPLVAPAVDASVTRAALGLPADRFLFLFSFDYLSVAERKNPLGLIEAFTRAFPNHDGPLLVLKTINAGLRPAESERVRLAAQRHPHIRVLDDYYDSGTQAALMALCDCYVSLHRSEGLGLTMAEAMALGKPVIATGYSGNLQFMTAENSWLVGWSAAQVPADAPPYTPGTIWADPDLDQAAACMREVHAGGPAVAARAARGRADLEEKHGVAASAAAVAARIEAIHADRLRLLMPPVRNRKDAFMSQSPSRAEIPSSAEPVEALLPRLEHLSTPRTGSEHDTSGVRVRAQRTLFRILRPYWFQQAQFAAGVVSALRHLAAGIRHEEERRREMDRQMRELAREVVESRRRIRALEAQLSSASTPGTAAHPGGPAAE